MLARLAHQLSFDRRAPALDEGALGQLRRVDLEGGAWVEHAPSWVTGQDALMDTLATRTGWREEQRRMYDRIVTVPRLVAALPADGPGHPLLARCAPCSPRATAWRSSG